MHMGQYVPATLKNPPPWNAAWEESYPFAIWLQDIVLWAASTDVDPDRQAPAVVMGLSGAARELCREVDVATLQNGILADWQDGQGLVQRSGLAVLLRGLSRKFAPLGIEQVIKDVSQFMHVRRLNQETIDVYLSRFDLLKIRAERQGFGMNFVAQSWSLLTTMNLPPNQWPTILAPGAGNLPDNPEGYAALLAYLRRQGHLLEHGHNNLHNSGRVQGGTGAFYLDEAGPDAEQGYTSWQDGDWDSQPEIPAAYWSVPADGLEGNQCSECGHYHVDSETDEDDGSIPNEAMFADYWKEGYSEAQLSLIHI